MFSYFLELVLLLLILFCCDLYDIQWHIYQLCHVYNDTLISCIIRYSAPPGVAKLLLLLILICCDLYNLQWYTSDLYGIPWYIRDLYGAQWYISDIYVIKWYISLLCHVYSTCMKYTCLLSSLIQWMSWMIRLVYFWLIVTVCKLMSIAFAFSCRFVFLA